MLKAQTLREMTRDELVRKHADLKEERFNLNMRRSFKALDNPLRLREIDREIARILTVLKEDDKGIRKLAREKSTLLDTADSKKKNKGE